MLVTAEMKGEFSSGDRTRGELYFRTGHVEDVDIGDREILAVVSGSRRNSYEVAIDRSLLSKGVLSAECSCPRFEDGYSCKHLWAVLLELEQMGLPMSAGTTRVEPQRAPQEQQAWQKHLQTVTRETQSLAGTVSADRFWDRVKQADQEIWYALNIGASQAAGRLVVELISRSPKRNGEFGKPRPLSLSRQELDQIVKADDRAALSLLLASAVVADDDDYDTRYYRDDAWVSNQYTPSPAMLDIALPKMAATGRMVWILETDDALDPERRLTWDDGPPWQFRLVVDDQPKQKQWQCRGELYRGAADSPASPATSAVTAGVSLDKPLLLTDGLVIWPTCVARLDALPQFAWIRMLRQRQQLTVPYIGREALVKSIYNGPAPPACQLPPALRVREVRVPPRARLQISKPRQDMYYGARGDLIGKVSFLYGEEELPIVIAAVGAVRAQGNEVLIRDPAAELKLLLQLKALGLSGIQYYRSDPSEVLVPPKRLEEIVEKLTLAGWVVEAEGLRLRKAGAWTMSVTSGVDWFDLNGKLDFDGQAVALPELLAAVKRGETYVKLGDGSRGMLPKEWLAQYGSLAALGEANGDAMRFTSCQALMLDAMLAEQEAQIDRPFKQLREKLRSFSGIAPVQEPKGFGGQLRHYQREGLGWLKFLQDFRFGGCLADDMGLGKTIQVLALLEQRRRRKMPKDKERAPSLVVVPKSLIFNWIDEAARFTPQLKVLNYTGLGRHANGKPSQHDVVVTTYGTLRKDIADLRKTRFDYAILDEAQAIKNSGSQAAKACRLIAADHKLAMTGTPVENHLGELWSLFEFLNPGMLGQSTAFQAATKGSGEGASQALKPLAAALAPFILRRTKDQVLKELPAKTEQTLYCEMKPAQRKQYEELRDYYRSSLASRIKEVGLKRAKIHVLESLLRLRQVACHPGLVDKAKIKESSAKLDALLEQLDEIVDEGHKALIFSQFTSLLDIVRKRLNHRRINFEYLDGKTNDRRARVERFQTDPKCSLFLISLKAGGHGLNLTAADYVYILDPWWNPAVEAQALDRAHRMGQTRPVFAYRLICRDTVEEKIVELQKHKRDLADAILNADGSLLRNLTAEDLQLLLS